MPGLKKSVRKVHRWVSLAAAGFWVLQAATGVLMVFHWELDDLIIAAPHQRTDLAAIERRLQMLAPRGSHSTIDSLWTGAGLPDRWDATVTNNATGKSDVVRLDGGGDILRVRHDGDLIANGGWIDNLDLLHQTLLAGSAGSWVVGLSGALLFSNLVMGLVLAWPKRGMWRRSLTPPRAADPLAARYYGWHRAVGLCIVVPSLLLVASGVERVFPDGFEASIGVTGPELKSVPPAGAGIGLTEAVARSVALHPGARLAGVSFPASNNAMWRVRLLAPGEMRRAYGMTTVWLDANDGRVLADRDAVRAPFRQRFADGILPFHTGELAGLPGRLAVMAAGAGLISLMAIGLSLWLARRRTARKAI